MENLYPVLDDDQKNPNLAFGLQQTIDGYGRHEVVIDHSFHGIRIHEMSEEHLSLLLSTYRSRVRELFKTNPSVRSVLVFENFGRPRVRASLTVTARSLPCRWCRRTSRPRCSRARPIVEL